VRGKEKPVSVLDYNQNTTGVDLKDQFLHSYLLEIKRFKWYTRMFSLNGTSECSEDYLVP
jgi:hypothetical protein